MTYTTKENTGNVA